MMIELHFPPVASVLGSIALTVPETDEWILADTNPPASAINCPART